MRQFRVTIAAALAVAAIFARPAFAAEAVVAGDSTAAATRMLPDMILYPGDALDIQVANYTTYSGTYHIDSDGNVQIPGVVSARVAGLTVQQARSVLQEAVWAVLKSDPAVTVHDTHRVSVLGEVKLPGVYMIDGTERVADLIARAGGTLPDANMKNLRVTHEGLAVKKNLKEDLETGRTLREIGLQSGDVVFVPARSSLTDWRNWAVIASLLASTAIIFDRVRNP